MVHVEIVYVRQDKSVFHESCDLPEQSRVMDALNQCGFYLLHPEAQHFAIGIFSKRATLDTLLETGFRIEIYRPLQHDPKEKRRLKARGLKTA